MNETNSIPPSDRLDAIEQKIDAIYVAVEKTRKYIIWRTIISVALFVLPIIGLSFAIPYYIKTLTPYLSL